MGLDMYLRAQHYVSGYKHASTEGERSEYQRLVEQFGVADFISPDTPSATVEFVVAYWRKAHTIHQWFVTQVQDGKDECLPHYVRREKLEELRAACLLALGRPTPGAGVVTLPSATGYDEGWYQQSLEDTVAQIDRVLDMPSDWSFYYRSSW